jgi:hypothetical protein
MKLLPFLLLPSLIFPAIVNPKERMVTVPGLETLGQSRISTVEYCTDLSEKQLGHKANWRNLNTDMEFELFERCLEEMT